YSFQVRTPRPRFSCFLLSLPAFFFWPGKARKRGHPSQEKGISIFFAFWRAEKMDVPLSFSVLFRAGAAPSRPEPTAPDAFPSEERGYASFSNYACPEWQCLTCVNHSSSPFAIS